MSDLISREEVLRAIITAGECEPDLGYTHLHKVIENLPSEVVRCKECIMTRMYDSYSRGNWCIIHRNFMQDDYFCADGRREP